MAVVEGAQKMIEALESGEYTPAKGALKRVNEEGNVEGYCCLGVGVDVLGREWQDGSPMIAPDSGLCILYYNEHGVPEEALYPTNEDSEKLNLHHRVTPRERQRIADIVYGFEDTKPGPVYIPHGETRDRMLASVNDQFKDFKLIATIMRKLGWADTVNDPRDKDFDENPLSGRATL